jgi:2-(1,2-epoxy-1,2-dihydrophenyl)acetyl-CoA isomerase
MSDPIPSTFEQIAAERSGAVLRLTLNRPDALNPLGVQMAGELRDALEAAGPDPGVRAVVITGAGRGFSSGADLGGSDRALTPEGKPDVLTGLREAYNPLVLSVRELPKPVIAAVNGPAAGIGCSLALACDHIIAAESAYLLIAFARIGLTIDGGASVLLAARAGLTRATEMALLAERIEAARALEWGLVNEVVADGELEARVGELAERLAAGPTLSYAASKRLLNAQLFAGLADQLDREAVAQQAQAETEDFTAGVVGFLSKQTPEFKGR